MGDAMQHTLINPNQLRYYGVKVQDNPMLSEPLSIIKEDNSFNLELQIEGTNIFVDTHTPSDEELNTCKHIVLSSPHEWDPRTVKFTNSAPSFEESMMA